LNVVASNSTRFPLAESVGIFIGIVAWNLLVEGRMDISIGLIIAVPCSIFWYCVRYWFEKKQKNRH
jgi:hypothetical protein